MDLTGMFAIFVLFGLPVVVLGLLVLAALLMRYRLKARALEVRLAEARAAEAQAKQLPQDLPEWIDASDEEAVAQWRDARQELGTASARAAAVRRTLS